MAKESRGRVGAVCGWITSVTLAAASAAAFAQGFTIEQALSAPFCTELRAAPTGGQVSWVADIGGRRNLWVAALGTAGSAKQVTHYTEDDGQEISSVDWTHDGSSLVYVRGGDTEGLNPAVPNPADFQHGAKEEIWVVDANGGEPRLLAEGHEPTVSPDGKTVAYVSKGQIWTVRLDDAKAKPEQLMEIRGSQHGLRWSPDGTRLAFVSGRGDHGFVVAYSLADKAWTYMDPSTDGDEAPVWSPDSKQIAFLRVPGQKEDLLFMAHREALPWSIRVADAATGKSREIWKAAEGVGSVYRETPSADQLHWTAGGELIFPWERDGWLHFYALPLTGGTARLLTPGGFEVEHISLSDDRKTLVFDSNQDDIDRRHVWRIGVASQAGPPEPLTRGEGIETQPVVTSDGAVVVLRSDAHTPMRAAAVHGRDVADLAPQAVPKDFPGARFVTPKQVIFSAADGMQIHGQIFLPPDLKPGEKRPAAVFFHGGSQRQMLLGFHYMDYYSNAYAMNQYLASKGYVVLAANYRSGIGYGMKFREALNYGADGASEFNDVMGAGVYLRTLPEVDGAKIASWGGSYGGYLTALALARASDLYSAGVDFHGVHDWNLEMPTFVPSYDPREREQIARRAFESSPMADVKTWRSPVLLIHGDDDRNVPFAETVQLVEALRKHKIEFEELIFPDEIHGFLLQRSWIRAYTAAADFLHRKLKTPGTVAAH
ncbi:S9 family peptidase [Occallatibacter riparius]|uniref:Acyl-peptide hydrolase n=1 Tax=Occallatibacter riparius TaxID=1002689 RepID=A0A9J7BIU4_9BACT|nr:prolyl oligopeptidase family serine peptidase [Occallatibacter riparius]UWZ82409.1 prolyl oligopeptidase family serine peptidase [Occallatibacter riparius]